VAEEQILNEIRLELLILTREILKKQVTYYNKKMVNTIKKEDFLKYKLKRDIYTKLLSNINDLITTEVIEEIIKK